MNTIDRSAGANRTRQLPILVQRAEPSGLNPDTYTPGQIQVEAAGEAIPRSARPLLHQAEQTVQAAADLLVTRWGEDVLQGRNKVLVQLDDDPHFAGGACWADGVIDVSPRPEKGADRTVVGSMDTMLHELGHGHFDQLTQGGSLQIFTWWDRALVELGADLVALGARPGGAGSWRLFDDGSCAANEYRELGNGPGFAHAKDLPTGIMLGPVMQGSQYQLASLLGGVVRDAVEAGTPESLVINAWVGAISDAQRATDRPNHQQVLHRLRADTIARMAALSKESGQRMEQAWDRRGLSNAFIARWSKPSSAQYR